MGRKAFFAVKNFIARTTGVGVPKTTDRFLPMRTCFVYSLNSGSLVCSPTAVIRSKADCPNVEVENFRLFSGALDHSCYLNVSIKMCLIHLAVGLII